MKRHSSIIRGDREDKSVSEIIGTILIFAILISLFTTFVLWYVPAMGTSNEQSYQVNVENAFGGLTADLHGQQAVSGNVISSSIPLGIKGVPPFSPSTDTYLSFSADKSVFSAQMSYEMNVTYFDPSTSLFGNLTINDSYVGGGEISSYGATQFITPLSLIIQDGALVQSEGQVSNSVVKGPIPVSINNVSGSLHLSATLFNETGPSTTTSEIGYTLLQLSYGNVSSVDYSVGSEVLIGNHLVNVTAITLTAFKYSISTLYYNAWNFSIYKQFVNDSAVFNNVQNTSQYAFNSLPFAANISKNSVLMSNDISKISLQSVSISYEQLSLERI